MSKFRVPFIFVANVVAIATMPFPATSADLFVSVNGNDVNDGSSSGAAFHTIQPVSYTHLTLPTIYSV